MHKIEHVFPNFPKYFRCEFLGFLVQDCFDEIQLFAFSTDSTAYIFTSRARASRVTEVSKEGGNYKQNGEPIGTPADRLVVTSLDSGDVVMRWCGDSVMWSWCDVVIW